MATYNVTLNSAGPNPATVQVNPGPRDIQFTNSTGSDTTLTADNGLFNPNLSGGISIPAGGTWNATIGNTTGDYYYSVPGPELGTRSGRINV